jgi:hypothetical protein
LISNAECSYERQAELSKIASNVQINYTYGMQDKLVFYLSVSNVPSDIYIVDPYGWEIRSNVDDIEYTGGTSHIFTIYSNDSNCYGKKLSTKYVNLPYFNEYSTDERCKTARGFKYCNLWLDTRSMNKEKFDIEYAKYMSNNNSTSVVENDGYDILDSLSVYAYVIAGIIVLILIYFILIKVKNRRRGIM